MKRPNFLDTNSGVWLLTTSNFITMLLLIILPIIGAYPWYFSLIIYLLIGSTIGVVWYSSFPLTDIVVGRKTFDVKNISGSILSAYALPLVLALAFFIVICSIVKEKATIKKNIKFVDYKRSTIKDSF